MFLFGMSLATILCLLAPKVIVFLYGEQFLPGAQVLQVLVWSTAIICMTNSMTRTTRASNRQLFSARVVALSAVLNVALNFLLIPKFQHMGAAAAMIVIAADLQGVDPSEVSYETVRTLLLTRGYQVE